LKLLLLDQTFIRAFSLAATQYGAGTRLLGGDMRVVPGGGGGIG